MHTVQHLVWNNVQVQIARHLIHATLMCHTIFRFRVTAYNDAGPSEPGEPSDPVVIDVPGVQIAPYFVLMLNDTIALEHEKVEFKVKVLGTPKPSIQWFKDDMEVFASDRLEIKVSLYIYDIDFKT